MGAFLRRSSSPQWETIISVCGRSLLSTGTLAMRWRMSRPLMTWPKTVCLVFRCGHGARVMKNLREEVISGSCFASKATFLTDEINSLTTVRGLSPIRHAHQPFLINLPPPNIFIVKFAPVDACTSCSITTTNVPALDHKFIDDTVEGGELVGQRLRSGRWCKGGCAYCTEAMDC